MKPSVTDYNRIASTYNQRYEVDRLDGISKVLSDLFNKYNFKNILEIGCGTGRWLAELTKQNNLCVGLDRSIRMIHEARKSETVIPFLVGDALKLPFKNSTFDFVYCVNAIHHFGNTSSFLNEAAKILRKNGIIAIIGFDPHESENEWYVYNYFNGTLAKDLSRYPSWTYLKVLSKQFGFIQLDFTLAESIYRGYTGNDVFNDPFLKKHNTSQLASISDTEYSAGLENIKLQIKIDPETIFISKFSFKLLLLQINSDKSVID